MITRQRTYPKILFATMAVLATVMFGMKVHAVESQPGTANTLKVMPVRTDIVANPGEAKTVDVTITNPSSSEVVVRAIQNDFVAGDEDGTPALILDENEYAQKRSLKRFMTPVENVTIPGNQSKTVTVKITVPEKADAGGYFGALRFAPTSPNEGGQVNLSASVASLILLRVSGDAAEKLALTDFAIRQGDRSGTLFLNDKDLTVHVRFKNDGDVQLAPVGKLSVKKGDKVVYEADFNNKNRRDMVLPESARRWTIPVEKIDGLGIYTVSATFTYGSTNQTMTIERNFWVVPIWAFAIAAAILLLIIVLVVLLIVRARKRSGKKITLGKRR